MTISHLKAFSIFQFLLTIRDRHFSIFKIISKSVNIMSENFQSRNQSIFNEFLVVI